MKPTLSDNYHARIILAFVTLFFGASFSPPVAATDIHAEWSNHHIADLFPQPLEGWTVSDIELEEHDTITSGFESYIGGLAGTDAGVSIRLQATRRYMAPGRAIAILVDSSDIETAASVEAIAAAHKTDDALRAELAENGVISISRANYNGFWAQDGDKAGIAFKVGSAGIVAMECEYSGCAQDLSSMAERLELGGFARFSDFDHRK